MRRVNRVEELLGRLPKWARDELARRQRRIEELERELAVAQNTMGKTRVVSTLPAVDAVEHYLPENGRVRFYFGIHWIEAGLPYPPNEQGLCSIRIMGDQLLTIIPDVSNSFEIAPCTLVDKRIKQKGY